MSAPSLVIAALSVPFLALSLCGMGGKKTEKDVCKHMNDVLEDEGKPPLTDDLLQTCETSMKSSLRGCIARQQAIDCYMKLSSSTDKSCDVLCPKSGSSPKSYGTSKSKSGSSSAKIDCINSCMRKYGPVIDKSKSSQCATKHKGDMDGMKRCLDDAMDTPSGRCVKGCKNL